MYKSLYKAYGTYFVCFEALLIGIAFFGEQFTFSDYLLRSWLLVAVFLTMPVNINFKGFFRQLLLGIAPFICAMIGHSWFRMVILGHGPAKSSDIDIFPLILAMACCALICWVSVGYLPLWREKLNLVLKCFGISVFSDKVTLKI